MATSNLAEKDLEFFEEITALMNQKYPEMKDKFGIWRIHQHFNLKPDEAFHETSNQATKESTLSIIKKKDLPQGAFASTWCLTDQGPVVASWCCDHGADRPKT